VWTPCAGPILATIATLAATTAVNMQVVLVTIVYVIGVGIPLFLFATIGRVLFMRSRLLSQYTGRIQQVFGVIMILTAVAIYTNYDKTLQAKLLDAFPAYGNFVVDLESNDAVNNELEKLKGKKGESEKSGAVFELFPSNDEETLFNTNTKAPEFIGITKWLNPEKALTMESLKGKVVLVDFWTYTCINCIRTLPYVTSWYDKYKDDGFVILTTRPSDLMKPIHNRMPCILRREDEETWLNPDSDIDQLIDCLAPYEIGMTCYPVSSRVNSPTTLRIVVCANCEAAFQTFSTSINDFPASIMR
jgi:thiol-disulfide isomerase/thioredoxin